MWKSVRRVLAALGIAATASAQTMPTPEAAPSSRFEPGQVWRYKTRPDESASRVIIGKVERLPKIGTVVHVKLVGLRLRNPHAPGGFSETMSHAPVAEAQVSESVLERTDEAGDLDGFQEGYDTWRAAYDEGHAGVFTIPLIEIVESMEQALNQ